MPTDISTATPPARLLAEPLKPVINPADWTGTQLEHFSIIWVHSLQRRSSWRIRLA